MESSAPFLYGWCFGNLGRVKQWIGGINDHVHQLINLPCAMTIADFVKQLKRASNHWIQNEINAPHFKWQEGYGAFSVSTSHLDQVISYIRDQENRHKNIGFLDEHKILLDKLGIPYDVKYLP